MGCGNCGSGGSGKPAGCKGNGGCSSGGCNRMNVFDWLKELPLHDGVRPFSILEVSFNRGSRKEFFRNPSGLSLRKGDWVVVEGVGGFDMGQVSLTGELTRLQMKKAGVREQDGLKRVLRIAQEEDWNLYDQNKAREPELLIRSRAISKTLNLDMKLCEAEIQADGKKATFYYTADQRVDFRELIKQYAADFKLKVEMRQIGARQESGKLGGIGSCGRELCCSTWLSDFKSVNTTAARYQNLSINQAKLSGQCGRLKCCLNYELDTYMEALRVFPEQVEVLETAKGRAYLQKKDIFRNLMWYSFSDGSKQYPLTIDRVKEIREMNLQGQKPAELQAVELETSRGKAAEQVDIGFVNDVGQISLRALDRNRNKARKRKFTDKGSRPAGEGGSRPKNPKKDESRTQAPGTARKKTGSRDRGGKNPASTPSRGDRPGRSQKPGSGGAKTSVPSA